MRSADHRPGIVDLLKAVPNEDSVECGARKTCVLQLDVVHNEPFGVGKSAGIFADVHTFRSPSPLTCDLEKRSVMAAYLQYSGSRRKQLAVRCLFAPESSNVFGVLLLHDVPV